jgi:hypothetical protein
VRRLLDLRMVKNYKKSEWGGQLTIVLFVDTEDSCCHFEFPMRSDSRVFATGFGGSESLLNRIVEKVL